MIRLAEDRSPQRYTSLPNRPKRCPKCKSGTMMATRATVGGGWGGNGLRFLYCCEQCDNKALIEARSIQISQAMVGVLLCVAGIVFAVTLDAPSNIALCIMLLGLGGFTVFWSLWGKYGLFADLPSQVNNQQKLLVEDGIFLSEAEEYAQKRRTKRVTSIIYAIVCLTFVLLLLDLILQWN